MTKIDIFSGVLGAGKTTLIKKMIKEGYQNEQLVLIENEFGQIGIDGGFLQESGIQITEMKSGCICCDMFGTEGVSCMTASDSVTAAEIDSHYKEYYVVASDDSWTYIRTHEDGLCGPYFLKLK